MSGSMPTISSTRIAAPTTSPPGGTWSTGMRLLIATSIATAVTDHRHVEVAAQGTAASTQITVSSHLIMQINFLLRTSSQPPMAGNEVYQATSVIPRRRTIYWRTADVSANGPSMPSPGRFIGDMHDKSAPTGIRVICLRHGSNELDRSSPTERSGPVILSEAKDLCAYRDRPSAEFTLSEANGLRVTLRDCSNCQGLFFKIEPCLKPIIGQWPVDALPRPINRRCARINRHLR